MAEPVHSPSTPHPRISRLHAVEAPGTPSIAGLRTLMVQDMPKLPSLAALHALTDRDLPSTDGLPMPESMAQLKPMGYTVGAVGRFLRRRRSDVCVAGDLLVYDEGRPDADGRVSPVWIAPDVLVVFGVEDRARDSYVIWQEGKSPERPKRKSPSCGRRCDACGAGRGRNSDRRASNARQAAFARAWLIQPREQRRDAEEAEETGDVGDGGENDRGRLRGVQLYRPE